jgi:putative PIN family toxin of toxin-antitoxin system
VRVILDTNVIMSAIFFGGIPGKILKAYASGELSLVLSPEILSEYHEVAERLFKKYPVEYADILEWITIHSDMVSDTSLTESVCADPDDDKFISAALVSGAKIICSGDKHLLNVNGYQKIETLKQTPFADKYL